MSSAVSLTRRTGIAVVTIDNPPVNALGPGVPNALRARIREANTDPGIRAIVIIGAGRTFPAGADIRELQDVALGKAPAGGPSIHDLLAEIEDSSVPVVMALHGTALGGGLELAMAGHYRVASPDARLGQPEVTLGIIPGAEGSQRLPRLVGTKAALDLCVSGRPVSADQAAEIGLVDRIVDGTLLDGAIAFAEEVIRKGARHPKTRDLHHRLGTPEGNAPLYAAAREQAGKFWRGMTAPLRVIEAIEAAATLPFADGCRREREIAAECMASDECRALIHAFFAEREARKVPGLSGDLRPANIERAAVVGAGAMGSGIATALARAGIDVLLTDTDPAALERGMDTIRRSFERSVERGRMNPDAAGESVARVHAQSDYAGFGQLDLVVEAAFEEISVKSAIFRDLDAATNPATVLASNTSTLDIDAMAEATSHPDRVVGLHFFNPAHVMRLVEIVRATRTSDTTLLTALELVKRLHKVGVVVGNCRGFVGNRMMLPYMREAQFLVEEGATPEQVDRALYEFGMAMGIFAVDDMGGLDLQWRVRQEDMRLGLGCPRPLRILPRLCELGRLGQKTGKGWYRYADADRTPLPDPEVDTLISEIALDAGIRRREITDREIVERCIYVMVNEGARILDEGHASRAADIDVIYLTGYGFPRWRGGPMWYADTIGLETVLDRIEAFHETHGEAWAPAPLLRRLVAGGLRFRDLDQAGSETPASQ